MSGRTQHEYGRDYSAPPGAGQSRYRMWMLWALIGVIAVAAVAQALLGLDGGTPGGGEEIIPAPEPTGVEDRHVPPAEHDDQGVPGGETVRVRDWEVTVLAASRDTVEVDHGEGPFTQHEVSMKVALHNAGDAVRDIEMLDWFVGSETGTNYAYSPHDNWCRGTPSPFEELTDLALMQQVFPGEVVVGSLCVAVPAEDVAGLQLHAEAWDHADSVESATLALPSDGPDLASVDGLSRAEAIETAWSDAATSGRLVMAEVAVQGMAPGDPSRGEGDADQVPLEVVLTTVNTDRSGDPPAPFELFAYGLSGAEYLIDYCDADAWRAVAESEPGAEVVHTFCVDVAPGDQDRLLVVAGGGWLNDRALTLRAEANQ